MEEEFDDKSRSGANREEEGQKEPTPEFIQELLTNRKARAHYTNLVSRIAKDESALRNQSRREQAAASTAASDDDEEKERKKSNRTSSPPRGNSSSTSTSTSQISEQQHTTARCACWEPLSDNYVLAESIWLMIVSGIVIVLEKRGEMFSSQNTAETSSSSTPLPITTRDDRATARIVWAFSIIVILHSATRIFVAWHRFFESDDGNKGGRSHHMRLRLDSGTGAAAVDKLAAFVCKEPLGVVDSPPSRNNRRNSSTNQQEKQQQREPGDRAVAAIARRMSLVFIVVYTWGLFYSLFHLVAWRNETDRLAHIFVTAACLRRLCVLLSLY